jgi:NhaP-type Na+/H+ or K+/H+ antiporter
MDRRAPRTNRRTRGRGVGSIYYATAAVGAGILAPGEATTVLWTVIAVVMVSIVVHGATGTPFTTRLHGVAPDADEPPIGATPEKVQVGR